MNPKSKCNPFVKHFSSIIYSKVNMNDGQKGSLIHEQWNLIKACKIEFLVGEIRKFIFKFGASRFSYQFPSFFVENVI